MDNREIVLFIGAHHEEMEAECPVLPIKLAEKGCRVVILNPIGGWNWSFIRGLGPDGKERTVKEAKEAAARLGAEKIIWDYPVAQVWEHRGEIVRRLSETILELGPKFVFIHWPYDTHADHREVAKMSLHALRTASSHVDDFRRESKVSEVYAFQTGISQAYDFWPDFVVRCTQRELDKSMYALSAFSGTAKEKSEIWSNNVKVKTAYWGHDTGCEFAEAYKFIGPSFPLNGLRLAALLGNDMIPRAYEKWHRENGYLIQKRTDRYHGGHSKCDRPKKRQGCETGSFSG